jgi:hypothetical protein
MSGPQLDIKAFGGTQIAVGLSTITAIRPQPFQIAESFKVVSGGTLWLTPCAPVALTGSSAAASIAVGYPVSGSEVMNVGGPATFYLSASGATVVVGLALGYTSGYTML